MTLQELNEWLESAKFVDYEIECDDVEYDDRSIKHIYLKDGKHYAINFNQGHPSEEYGPKGDIRGQYKPITVVKKEEMVLQVTWEEKE